MKKRAVSMVILTLWLLAMMPTARADSPVGKWSGTARGAGLKMSASASFRAGGSCSLSAGGYSASGSWSGGSIHVSAMGHSATLSYSVSGDRMTISGSYKGKRGSMSLSRRSGGDEDERAEQAASRKPYGKWGCADSENGMTYEMCLYSDGWLLWSEANEQESESRLQDALKGALADVKKVPDSAEDLVELITQTQKSNVYGTKLVVTDKHLEIAPLAQDADAPTLWAAYWDAKKGVWAIPYTIEAGDLSLFPESEATLLFKKKGSVDAKPESELFLSHVALKRGDRGEAVRQLQEKLIAAGHLEAEENAADGIFGKKTQKAVQAYQAEQGLTVDGIAGGEMRLRITQ
ncbi:MAG: peptidoglycan-binding domain-containing protein [Clostridia bacterium]